MCVGGGVWHDAWLCCCLQLAAPIGLSPLTAALPLSPFPPEAARPSASDPLVPSLSLPGLSLPPYSLFLSLVGVWGGCSIAEGIVAGMSVPVHASAA